MFGDSLECYSRGAVFEQVVDIDRANWFSFSRLVLLAAAAITLLRFWPSRFFCGRGESFDMNRSQRLTFPGGYGGPSDINGVDC